MIPAFGYQFMRHSYNVSLHSKSLCGKIKPTSSLQTILTASKSLKHMNHLTVSRFAKGGLKTLQPNGLQD